MPYELLDRRPARHGRAGAGPHARELLAGGLRLPNDETGDCHLFTRGLADIARGLGVDFRFDQTVDGLVDRGRPHHRRAPGRRGERGARRPTATCWPSAAIRATSSQPLGLDIPVYPVKGYSLTVPMVDPAVAPQSTVLDETYKVAVTRFDDRIRVGGMAELGGFDLRLNPRRRETLELRRHRPVPGRRPAARHASGPACAR